MGKILILNGSPRAPKSNSARYAEIFRKYAGTETEYRNITKENHMQLCREAERASDLLLVFPLYADGIPVTLLDFLKSAETHRLQNKPVVSVLINCGFMEYEQNDTAVRMIQCFCRQNGYRFGSLLRIGSGEAILDSPFRFLAVWQIRKLAAAVRSGRKRSFHTTMPLPKSIFVKASTQYWIRYGKRFDISPEEMASMEIEAGRSE